MILFLVLLSFIITVLVLLQVREGGLNVVTSTTLQAPTALRGPAKTLHIATIIAAVLYVAGCFMMFLR